MSVYVSARVYAHACAQMCTCAIARAHTHTSLNLTAEKTLHPRKEIFQKEDTKKE